MDRSEIVARTGPTPAPQVRGQQVSRRLGRALAEVRGETMVRQAQVQAESLLTDSKLHEVDYVTYQAMSGQAMLHRWAGVLAGDDIILADDLRMFRDVAKIGKGEMIADLVDKYRRI